MPLRQRRVRIDLDHMAGGLRVSLHQRVVDPQSAPGGFPVDPGAGYEFDPLQPIFHAPTDLFMQPGRLRVAPSVPARGSYRVDGGGQLGRHWIVGVARREYIETMFRALLHRISAHLPSQCAVCHAWPAQPVCEACVVRFAQPRLRCRTCALPLAAPVDQCGDCLLTPKPLDACVAAVGYEYPWSRLLVEFKFHARPGWAGSFATLLRSTPWVEPALERADLVLPMPLSVQRLRERGFNQALELARHLAPAKLRADVLLRIRDTPAQTTLGRAQRLRNVRHAFAVEPRFAPQLVGARVVLVDDVMTSGASLFSASSVLMEAGAGHITGMVMARADQPAAHASVPAQ